MMRANTISILVGLALTMPGTTIIFFPSVALSQEEVEIPADPDLRFHFEREGDGIVRLDRKTGETSFCRRVIDDLVCKLAIEERNTLHNEIADLQNEVTALREKLKALPNGEPRPKEDVPDTSLRDRSGDDRDKIEREMDRAIEITKQALRKLYMTMKELQREFEENFVD
jgi:hypothetical protein